jgi:acetyl-CoA synthetase
MFEQFVSRAVFSSYEDFHENFRIKIPPRFNFAYDVVDAIAARTPDKTALVWCNDQGAEASFSFGQMKYWSDKTANFLRSAGIKKGDPVMLILKRRYEFWFVSLALHKLGAICIPATHMLTKKDIVYRANAASIKMIISVADPAIMQQVDAAQEEAPTLQVKAAVGEAAPGWLDFTAAVEQASPVFARPHGADEATNKDIFLLYFTSGTTGMPKMVRHNFTYPLGHILTAKYWQTVQDGGLHFTLADTGWAKAAWGKIYGQWLCECAVFAYDMDKFVPKNVLDAIARHKVTSFCAPPTVFRYLIKEDLSCFDFSSLHACEVAGEPLNPEVYNQFLSKTGLALKEGFGQTETVVLVANWPWLTPKPGSMGKPAPGFDIDIIDENGAACDAGQEGQIVIRVGKRTPAGMFDGYYRDAALTRSVWHDGVYYTGDVAYKDEDGYFWFVGRADDCFKSSGYRIGPFEVESALLEHPAVLECAVTGVPDADRGQVIKATVVLIKGATPGDAMVKELQEHVKRVTAPYKYPRIIEFVAELPKTISGKIRRVQIRTADTGQRG